MGMYRNHLSESDKKIKLKKKNIKENKKNTANNSKVKP
jgi:hypothetical protein